MHYMYESPRTLGFTTTCLPIINFGYFPGFFFGTYSKMFSVFRVFELPLTAEGPFLTSHPPDIS